MARTWQLRNERWQLPEAGALMGILNVTPDSFSDGGKHYTVRTAMAHAKKLIAEGADIIDIGGESTRPGAEPVDEKEEQRRVLPVLRSLRKKYPALRISVDTRHVSTARAALKAGADIINDITGLGNPEMRELCAQQPCGIVLMHMPGAPFNCHSAASILNPVEEVRDYFEQRVAAAEQDGIDPERICLDPGIGFGKNNSQNLELIYHLGDVRVRDLPLLMGLSRKRFLRDAPPPPVPDTLKLAELGIPFDTPESAEEAHELDIPTIGMSMAAADYGADVHRVHDVAAHAQALSFALRIRTHPPRTY